VRGLLRDDSLLIPRARSIVNVREACIIREHHQDGRTYLRLPVPFDTDRRQHGRKELPPQVLHRWQIRGGTYAVSPSSDGVLRG